MRELYIEEITLVCNNTKIKLKGKEAFYFYIIYIIAHGEEYSHITYIALMSSNNLIEEKLL